MKKVLSLLVLFVFLNVSSWAYAPNYGITGAAGSVTGVFAGTLIPVDETTTTSASLGIFAIGIPAPIAGLPPFVQGAGVVFSSGTSYTSVITGVFDPGSGVLNAIVEGTAPVTVTTFVLSLAGVSEPEVDTTNIFAQGGITATFQSASGNHLVGGPGSAAATRLTGTASIDLFANTNANGAPIITNTIHFTVDGFQQSSTYSVPVLTTLGGTATSGSSSSSGS